MRDAKECPALVAAAAVLAPATSASSAVAVVAVVAVAVVKTAPAKLAAPAATVDDLRRLGLEGYVLLAAARLAARGTLVLDANGAVDKHCAAVELGFVRLCGNGRINKGSKLYKTLAWAEEAKIGRASEDAAQQVMQSPVPKAAVGEKRSERVHVRGYYRGNTYVQAHTRSWPSKSA